MIVGLLPTAAFADKLAKMVILKGNEGAKVLKVDAFNFAAMREYEHETEDEALATDNSGYELLYIYLEIPVLHKWGK